MRILVDGTPIILRTTGVGRYTRELLLAALRRTDEHHYTAFGFALRRPATMPFMQPGFDFRYIRSVPSKVYNALLRDIGTAPPVDTLARIRPDLAFFPNYTVFPMRARVPKVVVVYDLSFRRHPDMFTARTRRFLDRWVPRSMESADAVVAISEFTRQEIISTYSVDPEKLVVVPCGIDPNLFRRTSDEIVDATLHRYGIVRGYVLTVGTIEPRKNLLGLLEAFRSLPASIKQRHPLVIVGGKGWRDNAIVHELDAMAAAGEPVHRLGYVADADLPALYGGAGVFAYPTLYEGFGLPVLEAMACGAPVVTSNTSSLPEVAGSAAVLTDPTDNQEVASAIESVVSSPSRSETLAAAGIDRAKRYTWDTSATVLLDLFARLGSS